MIYVVVVNWQKVSNAEHPEYRIDFLLLCQPGEFWWAASHVHQTPRRNGSNTCETAPRMCEVLVEHAVGRPMRVADKNQKDSNEQIEAQHVNNI